MEKHFVRVRKRSFSSLLHTVHTADAHHRQKPWRSWLLRMNTVSFSSYCKTFEQRVQMLSLRLQLQQVDNCVFTDSVDQSHKPQTFICEGTCCCCCCYRQIILLCEYFVLISFCGCCLNKNVIVH